MSRLLLDIKCAARSLSMAPRFAAAAILMLAVGMGAATTIYSYLHTLLTAAAPPVDLERRVALWSHRICEADPKGLVSLADFITWRERARSFDMMAAWEDTALNLGAVNEPVRAEARSVTASYFPMIGVRLVFGRPFREDDERAGVAPVAVLGYREWRDRLEGDPDVLGRSVLLDGIPTTIVGVLAEGELEPQVLVPLSLDVSHADRSARTLFVTAALAGGATKERAAAEMVDIGRQLEAEDPDSNRGWSVNTTPLAEEFIGPQARLAMGVLTALVLAVLLIACANVSNLTLARGLSRQREMAVRSALGASTLQIVRGLLCEGLLVSLAASALGLLIAESGLWWLASMFASEPALAGRYGLDAQVYLFALGLSVITTLLFGTWPAFRTARTDVVAGLHETTTRAIGSRAAGLFRAGLVAGEAALTILFLVVTLLLVRTMINLDRVAGFGFVPANVLTARVALPGSRYTDPASVTFFDQATVALTGQRDVIAASAGTRVPAQGSRWNADRSLQIQGRPQSGNDPVWAQDLTVMPRYFEAMGIPFVAGRDFSGRDGATALSVAIINRTMANKDWPDRSPIGERLKIADEGWRTIVGVVGDVRNDDIDAPLLPYLYVPLAQRPERTMTLVIRTRGNPAGLSTTIRDIVAGIDRDQPLYEVRTMEQVLEADLRDSWTLIQTISMFALCALLLATAGIYAVVAHAVSQRTQEIGVRMALGASIRTVVWMAVREGLTPVGAGIVVGTVWAAGVSQLLRSMLYQVTPLDPIVYSGTIALVLACATAAALLPARRAARIDPLRALKQE